MTHTFNIKNYSELVNLFNDLILIYCKNCNEVTLHLRCGFKESNYRLECLKCDNGR